MNIISVLYMQQMMGTLLEKLGKAQFVEDEEKQSCCQVVKIRVYSFSILAIYVLHYANIVAAY